MATAAYPIFVYGTLMTGQPAHHLLAPASTSHTVATLNGAVLYDLGRYPMAAPGHGQVHGEIHWLKDRAYGATLARLDAYEGDEYRRQAMEVHLPLHGLNATAWVYLGRPSTRRTHPLVTNGDWRAWRGSHGRRP